MNIPDELLYTKEHEWISVDEDNTATAGITDYAQEELGDVVFVDLPDAGDVFSAEDAFGTLESVKAVSEVYMPVSGKVVDVNGVLEDSPEKINEDPYGEGWMVKITIEDSSELKQLMSADEYKKYVGEKSEG